MPQIPAKVSSLSAKATDNAGISQPISIPNWNPQGYLNNSCHRIAIQAV